MIIFQTAGCGYAGAFTLKPSRLELASGATTFRPSDYVHRLNRTLQAEVRTLSAYLSLGKSSSAMVQEGTTTHHLASRELVRLIVASRGVPEDRPALSMGLTRRLVSLLARMPGGLGGRASLATLRQLERQLTGHYAALLQVAPPRDLPALRELDDHAQRQAALVQAAIQAS